MTTKPTKQNAWNWISERGSYGVGPNNVKLYRGTIADWALVRYWDDWEDTWNKGVECIAIFNGSNIAEPYTDIKYSDSPFKTKNQARTKQAMAKVEKSYKAYLEEINYEN
tara:strand:+ start:248 stop:577 length:330 start_codon:yes stop_codon:yes gene_type:complete